MKALALALVLVALIAGAVVLVVTGHDQEAGGVAVAASIMLLPFLAKALG